MYILKQKILENRKSTQITRTRDDVYKISDKLPENSTWENFIRELCMQQELNKVVANSSAGRSNNSTLITNQRMKK